MNWLRTGLFALACAVFAAPALAEYTATSLASFAGAPDVAAPSGAPVAAGGNLYLGTSVAGGTGPCSGGIKPGCGTIYAITLNGTTGSWSATTALLYSFLGGTDGAGPRGQLVSAPGGVFYGVTSQGGASGNGTLFSLAQAAGVWTKTILYNFDGTHGGTPTGAMLLGSDGALYGTASSGGVHGSGVVFRLKHTRTGWVETAIYSFPKARPQTQILPAALIGDPATGFYGTTQYGGTGHCKFYNGGNPELPAGCGTVYSLAKATTGMWTHAVLYNFAGGTDDGRNAGAITLGANGFLYGVTYDGGHGPKSLCPYGCGIVYSLAPSANPVGSTETVLKYFAQPALGEANPTGLAFVNPTEMLVTTVPRDLDAFSTVLSLDDASGWNVKAPIGNALGSGPTNPFLLSIGGGKYLGVTSYGGSSGNGSVFLLTP